MGDPERTVKNPTTPRKFSLVGRRVRMSPRVHSHLCTERILSSLCQPHRLKSMPGTRGKQRLPRNQATQVMESHHHRAIPKSLPRVNLSQILQLQYVYHFGELLKVWHVLTVGACGLLFVCSPVCLFAHNMTYNRQGWMNLEMVIGLILLTIFNLTLVNIHKHGI